MKKIVLISSFAVFIFALPAILRTFMLLPFQSYLYYYIIYISLIILSGLIIIISITLLRFIKKTKSFFNKCLTISLYVFIILSAMLVINIILVKVLLNGLPIGSNYLKFNSKTWQSAYHDGTKNRQYMIKDLTINILPGKTKTEIEAILGKPDIVYDSGEIAYITGLNRTYILSVDMEILQIYLDKNGLFDTYKIALG